MKTDWDISIFNDNIKSPHKKDDEKRGLLELNMINNGFIGGIFFNGEPLTFAHGIRKFLVHCEERNETVNYVPEKQINAILYVSKISTLGLIIKTNGVFFAIDKVKSTIIVPSDELIIRLSKINDYLNKHVRFDPDTE